VGWRGLGIASYPFSYAELPDSLALENTVTGEVVRYERVRECEVVGTRFEDLLDEYCHSLSCGHDAWNGDVEPPAYCDVCGARVKGGAE